MPKYKKKGAGAKFPIILLATLLFILLLASPVSAVTLGDVTENNNINVQDVVLVMQHVLGIADPELTADQRAAADVNCDGSINVQDATLIMQKVLGLIDEFPCDETDVDLSYKAEATGKKVVTISFSKRASNPDDAEIRLMRDTSTIPISLVTTTWSDDQREVELRRSVNYLPGNYKVTISGLDLEKVHYEFKIEEERVGSISITSPNLVVEPTDARKARGHYRVYNQYDEDITSHTLARNLRWTSSLGNIVHGLGNVAEIRDDNQGVVTIEVQPWATPFTLSDELTLTVVDPSSEVKTTRKVGIVDTMEVSAFKFGEVIPLPAPRRVVEVGWNPAARILIERAIDEHGINRNTYGELVGQISLIASDTNVRLYLADKDHGYDSDKQAAIYVDTTGISTERTISISVISNKTGERFQMPLTIGEDPYARGVEIGSIENGRAYGDRSDVIASGDGTIYLPLTVRDQYGEQRRPWQIAADYQNGRFELESSNNNVIDSNDLSIETDYDSSYRGYLKIDRIRAVGYSNIKVSLVDTDYYDIRELVVSPPREPAEIHLPRAITRLTPPYYRISQGSDEEFRFLYNDQYGDSYAARTADNDNFRVRVSIEQYSVESHPGALTLSRTDIGSFTSEMDSVTSAQLEDRYKVTAHDTRTGVSIIRGVLQKRDANNNYKDLFEAKTYIEVVEDVIARLRNAQVQNLVGDLAGQSQEFRFTVEGRMSFGTEVTIDIEDSKGVRYSSDPDDYVVTGVTGVITDVDVGALGRNPVITFETRQLFIFDGRTVTITALDVNATRDDDRDIEVVFTRKDSDATAVATFDADLLP